MADQPLSLVIPDVPSLKSCPRAGENKQAETGSAVGCTHFGQLACFSLPMGKYRYLNLVRAPTDRNNNVTPSSYGLLVLAACHNPQHITTFL